MITDPHKLFSAYEVISNLYNRLEPLAKIPKELRTMIQQKLFDFSDAYESKPWGSATLHLVGVRPPKWTQAEMLAWNKIVAQAKKLVDKAAAIPGIKGLTKEEADRLAAKLPTKVIKIEEDTVITGKAPWLLGLGAAFVALMAIQKVRQNRKKALTPLALSQGLTGNRDQHAADSWHHLSRFSDHHAAYLRALATGTCVESDKLRTKAMAELEIARAFRSYAPKPRQPNITDGIVARERIIGDSEGYFKNKCWKGLYGTQQKLF